MSLNKVLAIAAADIGYCEEPPGSNNTKFGAAYGLQGQPWCVIAPWYWFREAGERMAFFGGGKTASCGTLLRWYREQGLTVPVDEIQRGDIAILSFSGTKDTQHCGLVTQAFWGPHGLDRFETIEGNTTDGKGGGEWYVAQKTRYPSQLVAVFRPQYQPEKESVDDITGHWAEDNIRWGINRGILTGYPDSSFRPDEPMTRAEAVTMLRRYDEGGNRK